EWVHVQLHQQKGMISLSPPTICNSAFPDSFENEASLISPLRTVDMGESIIVLPEQGPAFIRLRFPNGALSR
ncbi:hypothetical protein R9K86_05355, partial [Escherichia coli]|nr:hypothetical protein [Escherichia coli]MDW3432971.1 hypothetical protein [Escherichia coli]